MKKKIRSFATAVSAVESLKQILEVLYGVRVRFIDHDVETHRKPNTDKISVVYIQAKFTLDDCKQKIYMVETSLPLEYNGEFWLVKEGETLHLGIQEKISFTEFGNWTFCVARYDHNFLPMSPRIRVINERATLGKSEWFVGSSFEDRTTELFV